MRWQVAVEQTNGIIITLFIKIKWTVPLMQLKVKRVDSSHMVEDIHSHNNVDTVDNNKDIGSSCDCGLSLLLIHLTLYVPHFHPPELINTHFHHLRTQ